MVTESFNLIVKITSDGAGKLNAEVKSATGSLSKFESETKNAEEATSRFGRVADIAAGIITAQLVKAITAFGTESLKLGAATQTVGAGFEQLVVRGSMGATTLDSLREATRGMVADIDLMQAANKALVLGLPIDQFNELYRVATILGPVMGRTVTDAVNDLAMGIGRQSKMILDNLGIVVDLDNTYTAYGKTLGKTTEQMTVAEKKIALFNEVMRVASEVTEQLDSALSNDQAALLKWDAAVTNAKSSLGIFLGTFVTEPLEAFTGYLDYLSGRTEVMKVRLQSSYKGIIEAQNELEKQTAAILTAEQEREQVVRELSDAIVKHREAEALALSLAIETEKRALEEAEEAEKERLKVLEDIRKEEERIWNEATSGLETHWNEYFGITDNWYDNILDTAKNHFDDMRNEEETDHQERLREIDVFYNDLLAEQRDFLTDIRDARRTDLDDLELNFLLQKTAMQTAYDEGRIGKKLFEEELAKLEKTYRDQRSRTSDNYRIQELQAEKEFSTESQIIEKQRLSAIEAENRNFLLIMAGIMATEKGNFKEIYGDLVEMADTFGIEMGAEWQQLARVWGIVTDDLVDEIDDVKTTLDDLSQTDFVGPLMDDMSNLDDLLAQMKTDLQAQAEANRSYVNDPVPPPPPPVYEPPKQVSTRAGAGPPLEYYGGIPIYRIGQLDPPHYSSDPTLVHRFSITDVIKDLKAMGYAKGFEGWVHKATPMIVGEKGSEYVSITPKSKVGSKEGQGRGDVTINLSLPNIYNLEDPTAADKVLNAIGGRLMERMASLGVDV